MDSTAGWGRFLVVETWGIHLIPFIWLFLFYLVLSPICFRYSSMLIVNFFKVILPTIILSCTVLHLVLRCVVFALITVLPAGTWASLLNESFPLRDKSQVSSILVYLLGRCTSFLCVYAVLLPVLSPSSTSRAGWSIGCAWGSLTSCLYLGSSGVGGKSNVGMTLDLSTVYVSNIFSKALRDLQVRARELPGGAEPLQKSLPTHLRCEA